MAKDAIKEMEDVGDVDDIVMDDSGEVKSIIIGVGGFLGIGEKKVALTMDRVKVARDADDPDKRVLLIEGNEESLKAMGEFEPNPSDRLASKELRPALDTAGTGTLPGSSPTASGTMTTPGSQPKVADSDAKMEAPKATADSAGSASDTGDIKTSERKADGGGLMAPHVNRAGYSQAQPEDLTADKLQGLPVYGPNDESVGEIDKLVLTDQGKIDKLVVDVGGFLGMGAHPVAVTLDEIQILRNEQGDDVRVYIDSNEATLKAKPEYREQ
jgi:sporulation protein YlmC with PRC-barrel domain